VSAPHIRFSLQAGLDTDSRAWTDLARKAEDSGFYALYVGDHLGATASPFAALTAAALATSTLKVGTYVLNAGIRDPLAIASDAATVDVLSNGRLILGLGAGHTPAEWAMTGRDHPSAAQRVGRLVETVDVVKKLFAGEVVTHHGRYLHVDDAFLLTPRPVQDVIPLLIGGGGARVLRLGGRVADIVSLTGMGRTLEDGHRHEVDWSDAAIDASVAHVRDASTDPERPVLDALVQHVEITEHRVKAAAVVARHVPGAHGAHIIAAPYTLVGTIDQLVDEIMQHHERWGFTSYVVRTGVIDAGAALIERLRGT
jgi:probable F420-dependent oxidoreductase